MFFPKKVKFRKWQRMRGKAFKRASSRGVKLAFGEFGLKAQEGGLIKTNHLESARKVLVRFVEKGGKFWIRIFPDQPFTLRPPELGMGGGKGDVAGYLVPVQKGRILFEIDGLEKDKAAEALRQVGGKLPVKTKIISR